MDGESAYEIAVNNGFRGTEAEWLASLKGPQGDDKRPSFKSDITDLLSSAFERPVVSEFDRLLKAGKLTGPQGKQGIQGIQGVNGEKGDPGKQGIPGKDGKNGLNGRDGLDGLSVKGDKGDPGKDGKDGEDGKSAHQQWLDDGHTGDLEAYHRWLANKLGVMTGSIFTNTNTGGGSGTVTSVNSVLPVAGNVQIDIDDLGGVFADGVTITGDGTSGSPLTAVGGAVSEVTNSDGTLTISPTTGNVVASRAAITGDIAIAGGSNTSVLATVNGDVGTFGSSTSIPTFTVNGKGLITAASGNAVVAPAGTLTGTTLAANVVTSSLTAVGTLVNLTVTNPITGSVTGNAGTVTAANEATDVTCFPLFSTDATGAVGVKTNANLTFNSSTGALASTSFVGPIQTNAASNVSSNLFTSPSSTGLGMSNSGVAAIQIGGAASTYFHNLLRGTTATTVGVGAAAASHLLAGGAMTEAASGTHPLLANVAIIAPVVTGGVAATTEASTLWISGAPSIGAVNYALHVDNGNTQLDGDLGVTGAVTGTTFNGVALTTGGASTDYLSADGTYSAPSGGGGGITVGTTTITSGTDTRSLYDNAGVVGEYVISGTGNVAMTTSPVFTTPNIGSATGSVSGNAGTATALQNARTIGGVSFDGTGNITVASATGGFAISGGNTTITRADASAFTVGRQGATTPAFKVDSSSGTSVSGFNILAGTTTATFSTIGSASDVNMTLAPKGGGVFGVNTGVGGNVQFTVGGVSAYTINGSSGIHAMLATAGTNANARFTITGAADTGLTASTNAVGFHANLAQTRQHATGALTLQTDIRLSGSTHTAAGTSTATDVATVWLDGYAKSGTNLTMTNAHGIYIPTNAVSGTVTNAYGLTVAAPTGAGTINAAAQFVGNVLMPSGDLGITGTRVTKGWFTDIESTNAPTVGGTAATGTGGLVRATAPTLSGAIQLAESATILLDTALSATGTWSGIAEAGTAGATLAFGDLVYLAVADSRWELCDASAASTSAGKIGMCILAAAADGSPTTILLYGKIRADSAFPALTVGAPVYISETAGDIDVTAPTTTDSVTRVIGFGNTADELFFCPSNDYITHV